MQVLERIESIRGREHAATVELIEALVECHRTRAHVDAGYRSVFQLLVEWLHYSRAAASRRHGAMLCALRGTFVIDMLREHRTSLTALSKLAPVLDDVDDAEALLRSIDGFTPEEVDAVVAAMRPIARPVERVRPVSVTKAEPACALETLWGSSAAEPTSTAVEQVSPPSSIEQHRTPATRHRHPRHRTGTTCGSSASERTDAPSAPEPRVALTFTLNRDAYAALERVRTQMSRSRPKPLTLEETINALVRAHEEEGSRHASSSGKATKASSASRHIPKSTREAVFERDGHRCTYVARDGKRCTATHDLQIDHVHPYALGGSNDAGNLRVLCGAHNRRRAELTFGGDRRRA